jgi:hypothetical protein
VRTSDEHAGGLPAGQVYTAAPDPAGEPIAPALDDLIGDLITVVDLLDWCVANPGAPTGYEEAAEPGGPCQPTYGFTTLSDQISQVGELVDQVRSRYTQIRRLARGRHPVPVADLTPEQGRLLAQAFARHVKAALLHIRQAEDLAERVGVDLDASEHDVPEAGLIRGVGEAVEDLDLWAINNASAVGCNPGQTYADTATWCHAPGGQLSAGSWPEVA